MSQVLDNEVVEYEAELAEVTARMEEMAQAFISATIACLKQWYQSNARFFVQELSEHTLTMGRERLALMKQEVTLLTMLVPDEAHQLLDDDSLWWHRSRMGGWRDRYSTKPPDDLLGVIDALAERLIPLLEKYGYLTIEPGKLMFAASGSDPRRGTQMRDPLKMEWSNEMTGCVDAYKDELGRALSLDSKIATARKLKRKYEAAALWDEA